MMTAVEIAERKSQWRALGFLFLAALTVVVMTLVANGWGGDFVQGLWFGLAAGRAFNLLPVKRWLRPNSEVVRLLEDEGVRENRRLSCTLGFWGAIIASLGLDLVYRLSGSIDVGDFGQLIATAALVSAMVTFGLVELRGAR
jgi:hypothetical protein